MHRDFTPRIRLHRISCAPMKPLAFHSGILTALGHPRLMHLELFSIEHSCRTPADPFPSPIQEPPDPPENPDVPVQEPDPEDPGQI